MRLLVVLVSVLAMGCGKSSSKDLDDIADHACACRRDDEACGKKVHDELRTYTEANRRSGVTRQGTEAGMRNNECLNATGEKQKDFVAVMEKMIK